MKVQRAWWRVCVGVVGVVLAGAVAAGEGLGLASVAETGEVAGEVRAVRHAEFTAVLAAHVREGRVDYPGVRDDPRFAAYLASLEVTDVASLERDERLAFWINAYNAGTLKLVAARHPVKSITDLHRGGKVIGFLTGATAWKVPVLRIGGRDRTLDEIEHAILRKEFADPRIHFAIVCAAVSCPPLRSEAYEAGVLDEQLDDQGRRFLADRALNDFDAARRRARLSRILDWFGEDFGATRAERLKLLARWAPEGVASSLAAEPERWAVSYLPYDWALNSK